MRGMILQVPGSPLRAEDGPVPEPESNQALLRVHLRAVCRIDLHVVDGELAHPKLPLVPGHEIVGIVERADACITNRCEGDRVGSDYIDEPQ